MSSPTSSMTAQEVISALNLSPHPEKGYYIETFRDSETLPTPSSSTSSSEGSGRAHSTCIYYLLEGTSGLSHWHRVRDAIEVWHYYAGAPLQLSLFLEPSTKNDENEKGEEGVVRDLILGTDLAAGQRPQIVVRRNEWQHAKSLGDWTLVGCSVAPAFTFESFEMAEEGWEPGTSSGSGEGKK